MAGAKRRRLECEDDLDEMVVTIEARKNNAAMFFMALCLLISVPGLFQGVNQAVQTGTGAGGYSFAEIAAYGLMVGMALFMLCWMMMGRQVIIMTRKGFRIRNRILGFARTRAYERKRMRNLRIDQKGGDLALLPLASKGKFDSRERVGLAFDYDEKTVRFARYVDVDEAETILDFLQNPPAFEMLDEEDPVHD